VGSGGFGRVWKVQEKRSNQILAMKEISKAK
jgi:serine/threonine protein kinase